MWLVKKWTRELGPDAALQLMKTGNQTPTLIIRANTLRNSREVLLDRLEKESVEARAVPYAPEGIELIHVGGSVSRLKSFKEGTLSRPGRGGPDLRSPVVPR